MSFFSENSKTKELIKEVVKDQNKHSLILFNDDFNTFDHVINCLVDICKHDVIQAEQCAFIVHYSGKCVVKRGSLEKINSMCNKLSQKGLSVEVS